MAYVTVDPAGEVLCASAGHPESRIVHADGTVFVLEAGGLALGVEPSQRYEQVRATLAPGASVVLYTDGVIESRRGRELFGAERLGRVELARSHRYGLRSPRPIRLVWRIPAHTPMHIKPLA